MQTNSTINLLISLTIFFLSQKVKLSYTCSTGYTDSSGTCDECGVFYVANNVKRSINGSKIVGGLTANQNSWPSQVLVYSYTLGSSTYGICGGTLIKRNLVVTAAHCVYGKSASNVFVYLGAQDRSDLAASGVIRAAVSKLTVHSAYDSNELTNDIALLKLASSITLSSKIQIACMPGSSSSYPTSGIFGWAVGWGATSYGGGVSNTLNNVKLTVYDGRTYCNKYSYTNWAKQICVGESSGGKSTCQGDSGGPIYVVGSVNGKNKYILAGITSFAYQCAVAGYPGVYTRVAAYVDWINSNSASNNNVNLTSLLICQIFFILFFKKYNI